MYPNRYWNVYGLWNRCSSQIWCQETRKTTRYDLKLIIDRLFRVVSASLSPAIGSTSHSVSPPWLFLFVVVLLFSFPIPGTTAFLSGEHDTKDLSKILVQFITEVVLCPVCNLPEILIYLDSNKHVLGNCRACGGQSALPISNEKFKRYVVNHAPSNNKGAFGGNKTGAKYVLYIRRSIFISISFKYIPFSIPLFLPYIFVLMLVCWLSFIFPLYLIHLQERNSKTR